MFQHKCFTVPVTGMVRSTYERRNQPFCPRDLPELVRVLDTVVQNQRMFLATILPQSEIDKFLMRW